MTPRRISVKLVLSGNLISDNVAHYLGRSVEMREAAAQMFERWVNSIGDLAQQEPTALEADQVFAISILIPNTISPGSVMPTLTLREPVVGAFLGLLHAQEFLSHP
jgi:hypothetical protein